MKQIHRIREPVEHIKHQDLVDMKDNHLWKECPHCDGMIPLQRDLETMNLRTNTNCLKCGQQYVFTDIEEDFQLIYKKA